jgi:hypothetical protein
MHPYHPHVCIWPAQVARLGQLEVSHWELSRGIEGAQAARTHLSALCRELQAGRSSIALVLGQVWWASMGGGWNAKILILIQIYILILI